MKIPVYSFYIHFCLSSCLIQHKFTMAGLCKLCWVTLNHSQSTIGKSFCFCIFPWLHFEVPDKVSLLSSDKSKCREFPIFYQCLSTCPFWDESQELLHTLRTPALGKKTQQGRIRNSNIISNQLFQMHLGLCEAVSQLPHLKKKLWLVGATPLLSEIYPFYISTE